MPKGCKNNGSCQTGSCNKQNTFNWLADIPIAFGADDYRYYEISFKGGSRKAFYKNDHNHLIETGDVVVVETSMGADVGEVTLSGELVKAQMRKKNVKDKTEIKNILGKASEKDIEALKEVRAMEPDILVRARAIARSMKLNMKISDIEFQTDKKKATFFYTAEDRVDFRELIKIYAHDFKVKVEMRQIGPRQEAGRLGGIGDCGRELCCSTWLTDFKSVSTTAARYQNLSINLDKLSGQCGRLKCCLNYELDTYIEALEEFPKNADRIHTEKGEARLQKTDILKRLMFYTFKEDSKFYPVPVNKVKEILALNAEGKKPEDLGIIVELTPEVEIEQQADLVGQISVETLDKAARKNRNQNSRGRRDGGNRQAQNRGQDNRGGELRGGENRGGENRSADTRGGERRGGENRGGEPRRADNRGSERRGGDNRNRDNRGRDNRGQQRGGQNRGPRPQGGNNPNPNNKPQGENPQGNNQ
ncbi:MAG: regulatory iron-sulfur-containing complex subunit RicT [Chitinophagales bacterium]|nr:regulatory iron-sulfur-containing complex subunit RicT [Chitinophagales bacterium]